MELNLLCGSPIHVPTGLEVALFNWSGLNFRCFSWFQSRQLPLEATSTWTSWQAWPLNSKSCVRRILCPMISRRYLVSWNKMFNRKLQGSLLKNESKQESVPPQTSSVESFSGLNILRCRKPDLIGLVKFFMKCVSVTKGMLWWDTVWSHEVCAFDKGCCDVTLCDPMKYVSLTRDDVMWHYVITWSMWVFCDKNQAKVCIFFWCN